MSISHRDTATYIGRKSHNFHILVHVSEAPVGNDSVRILYSDY